MQEPNPPIYQSPEPVVPAVPVVPDAPPAIKSKLPLKWVFVILGVFVFLLLAVLALKLISGSTQPTHAKIVWWSLEEDADAAAPLISAYEQNNPNVTIQFVKQSPQDYRERLASSGFVHGRQNQGDLERPGPPQAGPFAGGWHDLSGYDTRDPRCSPAQGDGGHAAVGSSHQQEPDASGD